MSIQTTQNSFRMEVLDVFRFGEGRTVFVGPVEGEQHIGPCDCALVVDGAARQEFRLEGEMITDTKHPKGYRSISTLTAIDLDTSELKGHRCVVRLLSAS